MMDIQEIQNRRHLWVVTVIPASPWSPVWLHDSVWMTPMSAEITLERIAGRWELARIEARGPKRRVTDTDDKPAGNGFMVYDKAGMEIPCQFHEVVSWAIENAEKNWRKT